MAAVTADSVVVELVARRQQYERDMDALVKKTEDSFARIRKAANAPVVPRTGRGSADSEATTVEQAEVRKRRSRKKTADEATTSANAIAQATIRISQTEVRAAEQVGRAWDRAQSKKQSAIMGAGRRTPRVADGLTFDDIRSDITANRASLLGRAAGGDRAATQSLRDQATTLRLIEEYKRRGYTATEALARAERRVADAVRDRARREEASNRARVERSLRQNQGSVGVGIRGAAAGILGGIGVAEISALNDKYIEFTNRLRLAGLEGAAQKEVQDQLFASAQRYGVELGSLGGIFQKATEAGKEYGATQQQNIQFTNAIAAAVKVQGGSVNSARGAILQLGQALQSGTVRAEEFNSLMEGLFPVLQAAASASDKYGGSVAKLRAAVLDGKLTSQEFFNLILQGSAQLEERAAKATLTTAAGFTTLTNAITVYFGEADKANGVSAALGEAFGAIARNLDTLVPAIAAITVAIGVGYVGAAIAAGRATTALGAGLGLIIANPVVAALTAIAAAMTYLTLTSDSADISAASLSNSLAESEKNLALAEDRARKAGVELDKVGKNAQSAVGGVDNLGNAMETAAGKAATLAAQLKIANLQAIAARRRALTDEREALTDAANPGRVHPLVRRVFGNNDSFVVGRRRFYDQNNRVNTDTPELRTNAQALANLAREEDIVKETPAIAFRGPPGVNGGGTATVETAAQKRAREAAARRAQRAAEKAERDQARDESQDRQVQIEILRARSALTDNVQERADFELQSLAIEKTQRVADINNDKTLSAQERAARLRYIETFYGPVNTDPNAISVGAGGLLQRGVDRELQRDQAREAADIAGRLSDIRQEELRDELSLADTRAERSRIQLQLLELELAERQRALELQRDQARSDEERASYQQQIEALGGVRERGRAIIDRDNEGPLARYRRDIGNTEDIVENAVVDQLQQVEDGITSAISSQLGVKNPILDALIRSFIQQQLIQPLLDSFAGGAGGGSFLGGIVSGIGSLFGGARASGGNVSAGRVYRVNENGVEGFRPAQSGTIIPLGRMNSAVSGSAPVVNQTFVLDNRGGVTTPQLIDYVNRTARMEAIGAAGAMGRAVNQGIPQRISQYNKDGT